MQVLGSILRFLFAWIDGIVAKVITLVYGLLMDLANLTLYSENIVKVIGQRIGILLGIFMLFRLSVSLINYMISPDKFSDNKQGGGALVKNVIISLALLATVNVIFETAYSVQKKVVESQIIEKIFFGETSQTKMDIGYYLYTGFFTPNTEVIPGCEKMWDLTKDLQRIPCDEYEDGKCPVDVKTCDSQLSEMLEDTGYKSVYQSRNNLDMSKVFSDYDVVMANKGGAFKGQFLFNYTPIISTAAGIVVLLIMLSFSMELAKRAIKLLFLQIVAPVPIIFNMDTGKGKDIFQKWYKECFNTYISVFIRLLAINFAIFIIVLLKSEFSSVFQDKLGINIFIIIGCLLFAKEVPKLIENMFGIKMDGMTLRPLKNFQDNALLSKQISGLAKGATAGAIGIGAGALGAGIASAKLGNKWWETAGATVRGAGRGMFGGLGAGYKSKNALGAVGAGLGRYGTNADYVNSLDGTDPLGRMKAGLQQRMHIATDEEKTKKKIDALGAFDSAVDSMLKRAEGESIKHNELKIKDSKGNALTMEQHKQEQEQLNMLRNQKLMNFNEFAEKNGLKSYEEFVNERGGDFVETREDYARLIRDMQEKHNEYELEHQSKLQSLSDKVNKDTKIFATTYATEVARGNIEDGETAAYAERVMQTSEELSNYYSDAEMEDLKFNVTDVDANGKRFFSGAKAKEGKQNAVTAKYEIENNYDGKDGKYNIYQRQKANAAATKPKGKK